MVSPGFLVLDMKWSLCINIHAEKNNVNQVVTAWIAKFKYKFVEIILELLSEKVFVFCISLRVVLVKKDSLVHLARLEYRLVYLLLIRFQIL